MTSITVGREMSKVSTLNFRRNQVKMADGAIGNNSNPCELNSQFSGNS